MLFFERIITSIDAHTAGMPIRIITSGFPPIYGKTMLDKKSYIEENYDYLRKMIMLEPRGHSGMYGCIITPPVTEDGDFGVLFTDNEGYSNMCGHGTIGVTKVMVETGMIATREGENMIKIDSPAGRIVSLVQIQDKKVKQVEFTNVPSFVFAEDVIINISGVGSIPVDISFGGGFYAFIDEEKLGIKIDSVNIKGLIEKGMEIKSKVNEQFDVFHPLEKGLRGVYGTIITAPLEICDNKIISKNVCIFAHGQVDRSPCGTGTCARIALLHKKGYMEKDMTLFNKSIIDTVFEGSIVDYAVIGDYKGVIPRIQGMAHIMGFNQIVLDSRDPLPEGFYLG